MAEHNGSVWNNIGSAVRLNFFIFEFDALFRVKFRLEIDGRFRFFVYWIFWKNVCFCLKISPIILITIIVSKESLPGLIEKQIPIIFRFPFSSRLAKRPPPSIDWPTRRNILAPQSIVSMRLVWAKESLVTWTSPKNLATCLATSTRTPTIVL